MKMTFNLKMETDAFATPTSATDFLASARALGPVRAMLRTCTGLAEIFCSTAAFELTDGWLNVRLDSAHLHVELTGLRSARFQAAGDPSPRGRAAIWLFGTCGSPCVLLVCDRTEGTARAQQDRVFAALRQQFGDHPHFSDALRRPDTVVLH